MFEATKDDLKKILENVDSGKLQLPDFQRDYVWGDEDVKSLIASVAKGFPVGALLTLETGGHVKFKPRMIEGVMIKDISPDDLLLDGQQRMTSLYQAFHSKRPVLTKTVRGTKIDRYYYLDMKACISSNADIEDAIIGVPADKIIKTNFGRDIKLNLSKAEFEYKHYMFPLNQVFDNRDWFYGLRDYWKAHDSDSGSDDIERSFFDGVIKHIDRYKMPLIQLDKNNSREAICLVFEKVNVGGKKLDAFELVTAIYAADNFDLRVDWRGSAQDDEPGRKDRMIGDPKLNVLSRIANTDFLQSCTLLHTREHRLAKEALDLKGKDLPKISCNRDSLLGLPLSAYTKFADDVEKGFREAGKFLNELKIIWFKDIPYPPLLVTLASVFAILGDKALTNTAKEKLTQWLWCITLGELYGSSTETRLARDASELVKWLDDTGQQPQSIDEAIFQVDRLRTLRSRNSAAYKGIHALLMKHGCEDFMSGRATDLMTFFNDKIDIHHIFPKAWCKKQGIPRNTFNSVVNKTPLSKLSNIRVGGDAPSVYLKKIEKEQSISSDKLDDILRTHLIEPEHLRSDDFEAFFDARIKALSTLISDAMGKTVVDIHATNETEIDDGDDNGDDDDLDNEEI